MNWQRIRVVGFLTAPCAIAAVRTKRPLPHKMPHDVGGPKVGGAMHRNPKRLDQLSAENSLPFGQRPLDSLTLPLCRRRVRLLNLGLTLRSGLGLRSLALRRSCGLAGFWLSTHLLLGSFRVEVPATTVARHAVFYPLKWSHLLGGGGVLGHLDNTQAKASLECV